ncbi:unnamed protein product [Protopolystoma xenopodis]|uniref:Uncharacterized protein n=1 Tax=Protopolystoma xenopodis TaxID=117903 RepID=A0A448WH46_9PLAT|nr:unnamed protein product [Protopolystoma xenopodis]
MVLRMAIFTDDADYDAGETFGNVLLPPFDFGNDHAENGLRTSFHLKTLAGRISSTLGSMILYRFAS